MSNPWMKSPFPKRNSFNASPQSGVVQSDGEWDSGWQSKLSSVPQYFGGGSTATFTNVFDLVRAGEVDKAFSLINQAAANNTSTKWTPTGVDVNNTPMADFMIQTGSESTPQTLNPEWQRINDDYQAAKGLRAENQTRQQQAYDTSMMGNNAVGGVMPANYADPNFGQVTGRVGGLGGLGGMDLTGTEQPSTGVYTGGSGAYNPTPFTPGNFTRQGWSGF